MYHSRQNWSWTFSLTVQKLVSVMSTGNGILNMYRFANVPFKIELSMDFKFNSMDYGKCQVYWEWNAELCRLQRNHSRQS